MQYKDMTGNRNQIFTMTNLLNYILIPVFLTLSLIRKIGDFDIWYNLVIGRRIFETFHIPQTEFYVYPLLGKLTTYPEWGFGLFYYTIYKWSGFWGMSLANALIGGGTLYLFYRAAEGKRKYSPAAVLLLCALLLLVSFRMVYRPEMILYLCLAFEVYFLEKFASETQWKWFLPLPVLSFLLANFHPSVFIFLLIFFFYCIQFLWDSYRSEGPVRRLFVTLLLFLSASFLTSLINPYGLQQIILPFQYVQSTELLQSVSEYIPTLNTVYRWPFIIICSLSLLALVFQRRRRPLDWFLFMFFGYLGFRYVRNVALFGLMMYVPVVRELDHVIHRTSFLIANRGRKILLAFATISVAVTLTVILQQGKWGAGPNLQRFPDKIVDVIQETEPSGRILNYYDAGGYLAWKLYGEYRVFVDGRRYTMDKSVALHHEIFFEGNPDWEEIIDDYGINVIVTRATGKLSGKLIPLIAFLYHDDDWVLSTAEPWYYLFIRRDEAEAEGDIPVLNKKIIWQRALKEAETTAARFPYLSQTYLTNAIAYFKLGHWQEAKESFREYTQRRPSDMEAKQVLAWLEASERGDVTARKNLEMLH